MWGRHRRMSEDVGETWGRILHLRPPSHTTSPDISLCLPHISPTSSQGLPTSSNLSPMSSLRLASSPPTPLDIFHASPTPSLHCISAVAHIFTTSRLPSPCLDSDFNNILICFKIFFTLNQKFKHGFPELLRSIFKKNSISLSRYRNMKKTYIISTDNVVYAKVIECGIAKNTHDNPKGPMENFLNNSLNNDFDSFRELSFPATGDSGALKDAEMFCQCRYAS